MLVKQWQIFGTGVIGKVRKPAGTAGLCVWSRMVGVRG